MGGSKARKEGNYASSGLSSSDRLLLQNDLGLTLLPGPQIEENGQKSPGDATEGDDGHLPETCEFSNTSVEDVEPQQFEDSATLFLERISDAETVDPISREGKGQTLISKDEAAEGIAREQSGQLRPLQTSSSQQGTRNYSRNGRLRYSRKVQALTNATQGDRAHKRRRIEMSLAENKTGERPASRAPPSNDERCTSLSEVNTLAEPSPWEDRQLVSPRPQTSILQSPERSSPLQSASIVRLCLCGQSSTSFYPQCSKRRSLSFNPPSLDNPVSPQPSRSINRKSLTQKRTSTTPARAFSMLRAELKQTRTDLFQKTRAESDAQHTIYELGMANDALLTTANAHTELQKVHAQLLEGHRRLLDSYNNLAKSHAACRSTSSRKLAQRIIDAAPPSRKSACPYPSPSPSITAYPTWSGSYANPNAAMHFSQPATPLVDLTRSPSPAPASLPQTACIISPPVDPENPTDGADDPNYECMNGFDDEANEMFNALWENGRGGFDAGNNGAEGGGGLVFD